MADYLETPVMQDETGKRMAAALEAIAAKMGTEEHTVYGFHVNGGNSDPDMAVVYMRDAVGMTPAKMDFANDVFDYGSWADAFFMPRPCMVKYNGEVDYYLDPDDYTKKEDGTASDVANDAYAGNAMMEWPLIWWKVVPDSDAKSASVYIADHKADDDFHAWSNINSKGVLVPHFYTPIYNGTIVGSRLRSISGKAYSDICQNKTAAQEVTAALANNAGSDVLWYTEVYSDIALINFLLILISRSLNTQTAFGNGRMNQSSSPSSMLGTGTMDAKGLFWGDDDYAHGVKVFGMENWWGNQWRRYAGHVLDGNNGQKVKMTYGRQDGSGVDGYKQSTSSSDYSGYLSVGAQPSGSSGSYISQMLFTDKGMMPKNASGTATTFFCDGLWFNAGQVDYALRGGHCNYDLLVGAFYCLLSDHASSSYWSIGAAVSLKPLA